MTNSGDRTTGRRRVAIVDYQLGNLFSVLRACEHVGIDATITSDAAFIRAAAAVILPGVGAFGDAMRNLDRLHLVQVLRDVAQSGTPLLGVCLGMHLLFSASAEFGTHRGLDLISGEVVRFARADHQGERLKVPQVGWNRIEMPRGGSRAGWNDTLLRGIEPGGHMYFVHSYYPIPVDTAVQLTVTSYEDIDFCSGVHAGNITAFQFHPEKSARAGLAIYRNFADSI